MELSYSNGERIILLEFDGTIRELHTSTLTTPEHPVEKGPNVSDHFRKELARLACEVIVTNTPIVVPTSGMGGVGGSVRALDMAWDGTEETRQQRSFQIPKRYEIPVGVPLVGSVLQGSGALDATETVTVQTRATILAPDSAAAQTLQFDAPFDRIRAIWEELQGIQDSAKFLTCYTSVKEYENMILQNLTAPKEARDGSSMRFTFDLKEIRLVTSKTIKAPRDPKKPGDSRNLGAKPTTPVVRESTLHNGARTTAVGQAVAGAFGIKIKP